MILALLATTALLPPETARSLRCVAVLAAAADKSVATDAAFYTAIVGAEVMDATGQSREDVRGMMVDQVRIVRKSRARGEKAACVILMRERVAMERAALK